MNHIFKYKGVEYVDRSVEYKPEDGKGVVIFLLAGILLLSVFFMPPLILLNFAN